MLVTLVPGGQVWSELLLRPGGGDDGHGQDEPDQHLHGEQPGGGPLCHGRDRRHRHCGGQEAPRGGRLGGQPRWAEGGLAQQTPEFHRHPVPGWSDTEGRSDAAVFKELLRHLQAEGIHSVAAVVWCILPQLRMDAVLQAQARWPLPSTSICPCQVYRHVHSSWRQGQDLVKRGHTV